MWIWVAPTPAGASFMNEENQKIQLCATPYWSQSFLFLTAAQDDKPFEFWRVVIIWEQSVMEYNQMKQIVALNLLRLKLSQCETHTNVL